MRSSQEAKVSVILYSPPNPPSAVEKIESLPILKSALDCGLSDDRMAWLRVVKKVMDTDKGLFRSVAFVSRRRIPFGCPCRENDAILLPYKL